MTTKLTKLRIDRVDFVDNGANPGAFITLAKRAEEKAIMAETNETEVMKALKDQVADLKKRADEAEAKATASEAKAKETAEVLAKALDARETEQCVAIAKGLTLPGVKAEDKVAFVKSLRQSEAGVTALGVIETLTKQAAKSGLFVEKGSDGAGDPVTGYALLEQMADDLVAKGQAKNTADGIEKAMKTPAGREAYEQSRQEALAGRKGA